MKEEMKRATGIDTEALREKFTTVGHCTTEDFQPIPAKMRGLVGGWSEKSLSSADKKVQIKLVA